MIDINFFYTVGAGVLGGGIALGGVIQSVKGVKETQTQVKDDLAKHTAADNLVQTELIKGLARIEGILSERLPHKS
jgi:hypothetical protein